MHEAKIKPFIIERSSRIHHEGEINIDQSTFQMFPPLSHGESVFCRNYHAFLLSKQVFRHIEITSEYRMFNRPGVAGAVLQTPL